MGIKDLEVLKSHFLSIDESKRSGVVKRFLNGMYEYNTRTLSSEMKAPEANDTMFSDDEDVLSTEQSKNLTSSLDLSDEEDLLCTISMKKDEASSDSEEEEMFLKYEFSSQLPDCDTKQMVHNELSLFEKQKVPALQIGIAVPDPVLSVEEAEFSKHVLRVLKEIKFYGPSCIQSVVWPAVERGRDLLIVAPPHSGKTVSYVLPIVSRFTSNEPTEEESKGPRVIVLCSSWRKAGAVHDCFKVFLSDSRRKIFMLCTDGGHHKNKMQFLINNCDILIATPHCLLEFFEKKLISFSRLENFIVDDGLTVMEEHKKELKHIILHLIEAIKRNDCDPQLIVCSERWNKNFQIIVDKVMRTPMMYFTSFLEAATYAKIPISAHVCRSEDAKKSTLLRLLKRAGRIVIALTNASAGSEVHQFLRSNHINSYFVHEEMEHYVADDVIKCWKSVRSRIAPHCLVVSDQILTKMCISNADCLIHFDIPPKSRLQFGNRFSCLAEHFAKKESSPKCVCHILMLESEHRYAHNLVEIIESSDGKPSQKLVKLSKTQTKDESILANLCHYMKAFGVCKAHHCKNRHVIDPKIDKPQIVPYEGDIHGIVTHIVDASHYYVRLVKYLDPVSNKTVSLIAPYAEIGFQLRNFYSCVSGEMLVETPVVGECYVLEDDCKLFYRIQILGLVSESSTQSTQWRVLFLDEGWVKYYKKMKLYKLENEIDLPRPLAVEVYACNISPPDSCRDWNPQTSKLVSDLIKDQEIHGKIVLCIGKTLWLDPLATSVKLSDGNYVYPFKLDQKLLDFGHVIKNKKHVELLKKACFRKIPFPHFTKPKVKGEKSIEQPTVNYAFLECGVYEDVYVSSVLSPDHFYVQRAKFVECLDDLLDKIDQQVEKKKLKRAYAIHKDMICIAPFPEDNRYYRAVVTDISDDEVKVFFVDFGDSGTACKMDIYFMSSEFLLLPYQAIECKLTGIDASVHGWSESAISTLKMLTRDEAYDMKILQLKAYSKSGSYSGGNCYVVDLWDEGETLSEKLLQAGFGIRLQSPAKVLNDSSPAQSCGSTFDFDNKDSSSEDEEMDPEDKDITAQFYGVVAKMMAEEYDLFPLPKKPTATELSDDEEEILKQCKMISLPSSSSSLKNDSSSSNNNNLKHLLPKLNEIKNSLQSSELPSRSIRPLITWWDTPRELNIMINLKDIKIYELDVTNDGLSFNTIIAGNDYATKEIFYEKIHSSDAKINQTPQGISVVARKCTPFKWPRLTKEKKRFFHIKYDLIHIQDSDSEENSKIDKEKSKIKMDMRYAYEDVNDDTSDEEETYVESWREFAQYKDPVKDLLSEL